MQVLTKEEFQLKKDLYKKKIEDGAVFIYPTDTIYGIGCDARNERAISKIRKLKQRKDQPFSVIVPNKDWIEENCIMAEEIEDWLEKLPGPYTFLLNLEEKDAVAKNVNPNDDSIGIRIPDNWFSKEVEFFEFPIVTTSANISGNDFMTSLEDLDEIIKEHVDFIIYEGPKNGVPSKIVDFRSENINIIDRSHEKSLKTKKSK